MRKLKKRTVAIVFVLTMCAAASVSVALAKSGDSSNKMCPADAFIDAAQPAASIDANADLGHETLVYLEQYDICLDTTNADPNFDPLSAFDAETLDALRDADPETWIGYDPITGVATILDTDVSPSEIDIETSPCALDNVTAAPTAPVDISETFADTDDIRLDTTNTDPSFDPFPLFDAEIPE